MVMLFGHDVLNSSSIKMKAIGRKAHDSETFYIFVENWERKMTLSFQTYSKKF